MANEGYTRVTDLLMSIRTQLPNTGTSTGDAHSTQHNRGLTHSDAARLGDAVHGGDAIRGGTWFGGGIRVRF